MTSHSLEHTRIDHHQPPVIGIFDSGVGGLTVVKALCERSANLTLLYFGDTARFPYGNKSSERVIHFAEENTKFLIHQGAAAIVVACNTASAVALDHLRTTFALPFYGMIDPAVKSAVQATSTGRIGVIGTTRTIKSDRYTKAILHYLPTAQVVAIACPILTSVIEEGSPSQEAVHLLVREYIRPLKEHQIDTLLLGCTHYPLLTPLFQQELGPSVRLIDPAQACAEAVYATLLQPTIQTSLSNGSKGPSAQTESKPDQIQFFVSDDGDRFKTIGEMFLGMKMERVQIVPYS